MTTLRITGMTCGHCRMHVEKALAAVPGASRVEVDLAAGLARIEGTAAVPALKAAVEAEGYGVAEVPA